MSNITNNEQYALRGNRVTRRSASEIERGARHFCLLFHVSKKTGNNIARFIELLSTQSICVDPIDDREWIWVTDAICSPENFTILVPSSLYEDACRGDRSAIGTLCHEIGHLVLGHKAVLHNEKSAHPCHEEDAEWQADVFSAFVVSRMGIPASQQLMLDFF